MRVGITSLCKSFARRDGDILKVLDNITLTIQPHEFCCLVGPSGCGKSTILNILAGIVMPDVGEITIEGIPLAASRARIGYVFQKPRLLNWKTANQNVIFALRALGFPREEWDERASGYLELVGLKSFDQEYPLALSGGMQQRVAIARALAIDPDILLMDEPFSHLDELTARSMRKELLSIWQQKKKTVIFVTHNALEAVYLADRVFLLGTRPTRVLDCFLVGVPRQREMEDPRLIELQREIVKTLEVV